jgi:hypothetical protein
VICSLRAAAAALASYRAACAASTDTTRSGLSVVVPEAPVGCSVSAAAACWREATAAAWMVATTTAMSVGARLAAAEEKATTGLRSSMGRFWVGPY